MIRWTQPEAPILAIMSHRRSNYFQPVACHQEHEIHVALSGEGKYWFGNDKPMRLTAGEILLMPGGTSHAIEVERYLRIAAIHIHPKAFDAVVAPSGAQSKLLAKLKSWTKPPPWRKVITPDAYAMLEQLAEEAVVEQNRQAPARESLLQALATQAAVHFLRLMLMEEPTEASDETTRRILTIQNWIDRHFVETCGVASLAKMAHLAPTYFASRFRKLVGTPPMTYVCQRRLEQARLLLEQTDQQVKVVAWSVGFSDVSHFNHAFKKAVGQPPLEYRKRSQKAEKRR